MKVLIRKKPINAPTVITIGIAIFFCLFLISINDTQAQNEVLQYRPQISIPVPGAGLESGQEIPVDGNLISRYIKAIYDYGLMIAGILAAIVLMGGGLLWLSSAGNDTRISQAKELIIGSVSGLAILLCSWIILNTVNPSLLRFQPIIVPQIQKEYLQASGFYENIKDLPQDMLYKWICVGHPEHSCADTIPPTANLELSICASGNPENSKPSNCPYGQLWCCGQSNIDVNLSNICKNKNNGTACRVTSTAALGSGYCYNQKCEPCKRTGNSYQNEGAICGNHYECKSDYNFCGRGQHGYCFCNVIGGNCTCRYERPIW